MNYRCHECGDTFESPHTNYKHAKGFHPEENPEHSADKAKELDHCQTCQRNRSYDPVAARTRDLANAMGPAQSDALTALNAQVTALKAQVAQAKIEQAAHSDLAAQVKELTATLATLKTPSPQAAPSV